MRPEEIKGNAIVRETQVENKGKAGGAAQSRGRKAAKAEGNGEKTLLIKVSGWTIEVVKRIPFVLSSPTDALFCTSCCLVAAFFFFFFSVVFLLASAVLQLSSLAKSSILLFLLFLLPSFFHFYYLTSCSVPTNDTGSPYDVVLLFLKKKKSKENEFFSLALNLDPAVQLRCFAMLALCCPPPLCIC